MYERSILCMQINHLLEAIWLTICPEGSHTKTNRNYNSKPHENMHGQTMVQRRGEEVEGGREREREPQQDGDLKHGSREQKQILQFEQVRYQPKLSWRQVLRVQHMKVREVNQCLIQQVGYILTINDVFRLYPKAFVTIEATAVLTTTTRITDASKISTWFQRNCTCISIPILERKRAANRLRIGSTYSR